MMSMWKGAWPGAVIVISFVTVLMLDRVARSGPCLALPVAGDRTPASLEEEEEADDHVPLTTASEEQLEMIKRSILSELGMSRVPDMSRANVSQEKMEQMLALYHRSVREMDEKMKQEDEEEEEEEDNKAVHRFYSYTEQIPPSEPSRLEKVVPEGGQVIYFPMNTGQVPGVDPNTSRGVKLYSAKLRVFKEKTLNQSSTPKLATARIYQLLDSNEKDRLVPIHVKSIKLDEEGWEDFDITQLVQIWMEQPKTNLGLVLVCPECLSNGYHFHSRTIQQKFATLPNLDKPCTSCKNVLLKQPLKEAILDILVEETLPRTKRSLAKDFSSAGVRNLDCTKGKNTSLCCRYGLVVSFKEIGWDWVFQPPTFQAFFCKGKCPYKRNKIQYASPHALIQSIMSLKKGRSRVPRPCCAPKKLAPLTFLHYNDKNPPELIVTRQKGMVVRKCACS